MSILAWMALGLSGGVIVGWLRKRRGRVLAADAAVGALGATLGGFLASVLLRLDVVGIEPTSLVVALLGAGLLLVILHTLPTPDVFAE
ncbi:MAG: hypothetical protein NVSMB2_10560 [Chloroflexota bacterium]